MDWLNWLEVVSGIAATGLIYAKRAGIVKLVKGRDVAPIPEPKIIKPWRPGDGDLND